MTGVAVAPNVSLIDRIPPNSLEAEAALLGSILVDKEIMPAVSEIIRSNDFYAPFHELIYSSLRALYEASKPLDKVALAEELRARGMLDKIGGLAYLTSLMDTVPTAASAEYYAKIVREKASLRGLIHAGTRITQLGYESEEDVPAALDASEQIVREVVERKRVDRGWADHLRSAADIAELGVSPVVFDIDGIAEADGGPIVIFAEPEGLKTWVALLAAAAIVTGKPFLGHFPVRQRPWSIIVNLDAGRAAIERRIALLRCEDPRLLVVTPESWDVERFEELLATHPGAWVVIDCLADVFQPDPSEEQGIATRRFLRELRMIFERHGANGMIVDHARRQTSSRPGVDYYGSVQRKAAVRMMWALERVREADRLTNSVVIRCEKMSESERFPAFIATLDFGLDCVAAGYGGLADAAPQPKARRTAVDDAADTMLAMLRERGSFTRDELGVRKSNTTRAAFNRLIDDGIVRAVTSGRPERFDLAERADQTVALDLVPDGTDKQNFSRNERTKVVRSNGTMLVNVGVATSHPMDVEPPLCRADHSDHSPVGGGPGPNGPNRFDDVPVPEDLRVAV